MKRKLTTEQKLRKVIRRIIKEELNKPGKFKTLEDAFGGIHKLVDLGYNFNTLFDQLDTYLTKKGFSDMYDEIMDTDEFPTGPEADKLKDAVEAFYAMKIKKLNL